MSENLQQSLAIIQDSRDFEEDFFKDYSPEKPKNIQVDKSYFMINNGEDGLGGEDVSFENLVVDALTQEHPASNGKFADIPQSDEISDVTKEKVEYKGKKQRF